MSFLNIEIKARTNDTSQIREFLIQQGADFKGTDVQTDTYFNVTCGRLKLREGSIENNLIFYDRANSAGPKQSYFELVPVPPGGRLKDVLTKAVGIKIEVKKSREIYFIDNVKFHLDHLEKLGDFVEIEASNIKHDLTINELREQCHTYMTAIGIKKEDLISSSYSDMLLHLISEE